MRVKTAADNSLVRVNNTVGYAGGYYEKEAGAKMDALRAFAQQAGIKTIDTGAAIGGKVGKGIMRVGDKMQLNPNATLGGAAAGAALGLGGAGYALATKQAGMMDGAMGAMQGIGSAIGSGASAAVQHAQAAAQALVNAPAAVKVGIGAVGAAGAALGANYLYQKSTIGDASSMQGGGINSLGQPVTMDKQASYSLEEVQAVLAEAADMYYSGLQKVAMAQDLYNEARDFVKTASYADVSYQVSAAENLYLEGISEVETGASFFKVAAPAAEEIDTAVRNSVSASFNHMPKGGLIGAGVGAGLGAALGNKLGVGRLVGGFGGALGGNILGNAAGLVASPYSLKDLKTGITAPFSQQGRESLRASRDQVVSEYHNPIRNSLLGGLGGAAVVGGLTGLATKSLGAGMAGGVLGANLGLDAGNLYTGTHALGK